MLFQEESAFCVPAILLALHGLRFTASPQDKCHLRFRKQCITIHKIVIQETWVTNEAMDDDDDVHDHVDGHVDDHVDNHDDHDNDDDDNDDGARVVNIKTLSFGPRCLKNQTSIVSKKPRQMLRHKVKTEGVKALNGGARVKRQNSADTKRTRSSPLPL